jgi:acyl-CoA reductase-like NAD-dependent aldehyde dehydrogenase
MSDYEELLDQVRKLSVLEQARLLEELAKLVRAHIQEWFEHSVLELRGLGKELWRGIDVEKYIEEERNSWERE